MLLLGPAPTHIGIEPLGTYINTILKEKDKLKVNSFRFATAYAQESSLSVLESINGFLKYGGT